MEFFRGAEAEHHLQICGQLDGRSEEKRYCPQRNFVLSITMTTITCKIPDKISAHLEAAARQRRVSKSQIVREALAASFRKNKPQVSAFDLIKDLCGVVKGGPKDYASHPRHLKGFGKP